MNLVVLTGRLTNDIEVKQTQSGVPFAKFCIAVDKEFNSGEERQANFINVTAWRKSAEFLAKYFRKGDGITISGSIDTNQYTDKDGNKRTSFEVLMNKAEFPIAKKSGNGTSSDSGMPTSGSAPLEAVFTEVGSEDDLPFNH